MVAIDSDKLFSMHEAIVSFMEPILRMTFYQVLLFIPKYPHHEKLGRATIRWMHSRVAINQK